ncbi:DUF4293 domain-containing protein [Fulvivirga lutea]|uniref:DUF4293 domain-containing protein n=1 Tax=Fulvivirga lutea TaxID=2810512 RepID=A0A975A1A0_9BACT|nr:DUF4293 domain-containing protein [Fulvivirga lutea]QSE98076.1 DUF4293 domain-containing protein [Fulvivirga lutea]
MSRAPWHNQFNHMLQRIQTIFLILVVLFMGLSFLFPLWTLTNEEGIITHQLFNLKLNIFSLEDGSLTEVYYPYLFVGVLAATTMVIAILEISKFKNRLLQMKLGALNAMLMAGTLGIGVYFATDLINSMVSNGGAYGPGLFLPAAAMICNIIANRFIRKDERLVRSVDRIR